MTGGKAVSDAQVAANRRNAQKSTGPRTAAGKSRSAANSSKHGAYASELHPLRAGPLAEDDEKFYAKAEALIAGFDPVGDLELELAKRAASALMRMKRLDDFQTAMDDITAIPDGVMSMLHGDLAEALRIVGRAETLLEFAEANAAGTVDDLDYVDYRSLAKTLREHICPGLPNAARWAAGHDPDVEAGWEEVVHSIMEDISSDSAEQLRAARGLLHGARFHHFGIEHKSKAALARRLINSDAANLERPRAALWREFNNAVRQLTEIRSLRPEEVAEA